VLQFIYFAAPDLPQANQQGPLNTQYVTIC